jgi:phage recombination protein Bet
MSKELTTTSNLDMINTLRHTVAPGLTDSEFLLFTEMVKSTGLNPITKEIWAIKAGGRLQIMTGINGFLKIANSHSHFDGMEVTFEWSEDGKALISSTAKVYRKDRRFPSVATAYLAEYGKQSPIWKQMPSIMLSKCAKSLAIREAFINELGGLYTQEEMPDTYSQGYQDKVNHKLEPTEDAEIVTKNGRVIGLQFQPVSQDESGALKAKRAIKTRYDIRNLSQEQQDKASDYLRERMAIFDEESGIWTAPIRLDRLQSCIVEE